MANAQYNDNLKIDTLLDNDLNSIGQKITYPNVLQAQVTIKKITFPPGSSTGMHKHILPVFSYVIKGTLTVEIEGHPTKNYSENSCFSESFDTFHKGSNYGDEDLVVIAIYLGGDHLPHSIPEKAK